MTLFCVDRSCSFIEPHSAGVCVLCLWFLQSGSHRISQWLMSLQSEQLVKQLFIGI